MVKLRHCTNLLLFGARFQTFNLGLVVHIWHESNIMNMVSYTGEMVLVTLYMINFFPSNYFCCFRYNQLLESNTLFIYIVYIYIYIICINIYNMYIYIYIFLQRFGKGYLLKQCIKRRRMLKHYAKYGLLLLSRHYLVV